MKNVRNITILSILIGLMLSACVPAVPATSTPGVTPQTTERPAQVQSVSIEVIDGNPPQMNAVVRGNLSESCATLAPSQVTYSANVFEIKVYAVSPSDRGCAQVTAPFETTVALDIRNLPVGSYTVTANGVSAIFALQAGNPTSTAAPMVTPTAVPTSQGCIDSAAFVSDISIPDNTVLAPNTPFTKTWRLKNTGSCTWDSGYLVSYVSGSTMTQQPGYWIVPQGQTVPPGQTVDISVGMTSPVQSGNYGSYWGLKKEHGQLMPIQGGANGNSFYVKIRVNNGAESTAGRITAASIDIELEQGSGTVCTADATYFVHAYITADGPTTASYEIESSAGQIPAGNFTIGYTTPVYPVDRDNVVFAEAGTKTISLRFVGPYPYPSDITVMLRVNGGDWHNTKLSCQG
jgi:Ig-like domain-containing protein